MLVVFDYRSMSKNKESRMKAVICQNEKLSLAELPEPQLTKW